MSKAAIRTDFGNAWEDTGGYRYISTKIDGRWTSKPVHILIWESVNGPVPDGCHIHHINEIPDDNRIENLLCVTQSDHRRIHAGWVKQGPDWTHKPCGSCKILLPLTEYRKQKKGGDRLQVECKKCDNKRRVIRARLKRNATNFSRATA